jgi:hypothetical protein
MNNVERAVIHKNTLFDEAGSTLRQSTTTGYKIAAERSALQLGAKNCDPSCQIPTRGEIETGL